MSRAGSGRSWVRMQRASRAAVFATSYLETLGAVDLTTFGETAFADGDPFGIPEIP